MSLLNQQIPQFEATHYQAGEFKDLTDKDLLGHWSVVFFYPADFTFVCPTELSDLADLYPQFVDLGAEVYSVSTDTHFSHLAWHDSSEAVGKINFPMVGDPTGAISRGFDVFIEDAGLAERGTFIINPEGIIKAVEISDGAVGRNAADTLRKIKALQWVAANPADACPAKWALGDEVLHPGADLVGKI
ncbi:MAG: alkyl hydroperoxide reductase subunit C [Micrococcales bacterium]|nr:alkyl hydroperoxide reductase subunit C [Micrococcales bacterium]